MTGARVRDTTSVFAAPGTNCPFLLAAGREGLLGYDGSSAPVEPLRELLGPGLGRVGALFARLNHPVAGDPLPALRRRRYDPVHLAGSRGDHPGSTAILEGPLGLDVTRLDGLLAQSRDSVTLTRRDLARGIAASNAADPGAGLVDLVRSAGEFALLVGLLGRGGATGRAGARLLVAEVRDLFGQARLPAAWRTSAQRTGTLTWLADSGAIAALASTRWLRRRHGPATSTTVTPAAGSRR